MSRNRLIAILGAAATASLLVACEGEPPKVPFTPLPAVAHDNGVPEPAPAEGAMPARAPAVANAPAAPAASGAATAGPAGAASGAPAAGAAPPAATHGSIAGSVTTQPASMAGHAVVWLEDAPPDPESKHGNTARVDNRAMSFLPFVQVVTVGGKVTFSNGDPFPHNVFSPDNEKFNMGTVAPKMAAARVFDKVGQYALLCNLHPNMLGYVVVTPTTYFAKADAKGHFTIGDVPSGTYKVTAWAPRQKPVTEPVVVKDGEASISFDLHR